MDQMHRFAGAVWEPSMPETEIHNGMRETQIYDAARAGDLLEVKALLKHQPDLVFSKARAGGTALHYAARNGHKDVAELLLANHADVNDRERDKGWTPLHCAAKNGHKDVAELLLGVDQADVNARGESYDDTPL